MQDSAVLDALASALVAGNPSRELLISRCVGVLGRKFRWLPPLVRRYLQQFGTSTRPRTREVIGFLRNDVNLRKALATYKGGPSAHSRPLSHEMFAPPGAGEWNLPAVETTGDLAKWLGLTPGELRWFADLKALGYKKCADRLRHYHYRIVTKHSGSIRLIEAPKARMQDLQRQILLWILDKVPPHPAAHGFVKGRSIKSFAAPHVGQRVLLRMDLRDFFPSLSGVRIQSVFRAFGYPESVSDLLGGICTNVTPRDAWNAIPAEIDVSQIEALRRLYARPHLPQGAPSSPALANICFYRADCRLSALAASAGARYSRYADDLAFSGGEQFERCVLRFSVQVAALLSEHGFSVNHRKTRLMHRGTRQRAAGIVINEKLNVARRDFDQLKAILHNCVRFGAASQNVRGLPNFRAHLEGRISFVAMLNPERGRKLRRVLERITWTG